VCDEQRGSEIIRWSIAFAVPGVAAIAAVVSYEHAYDFVRAQGEAGRMVRASRDSSGPKGQVSTTFSIVDMDMGVANVLPSPVSWGGLHGCVPIAWCHVCDTPVFTASGPASGLLCFVRHPP
jgi:hypothetical protein